MSWGQKRLLRPHAGQLWVCSVTLRSHWIFYTTGCMWQANFIAFFLQLNNFWYNATHSIICSILRFLRHHTSRPRVSVRAKTGTWHKARPHSSTNVFVFRPVWPVFSEQLSLSYILWSMTLFTSHAKGVKFFEPAVSGCWAWSFFSV